jgi:hypothetical protein
MRLGREVRHSVIWMPVISLILYYKYSSNVANIIESNCLQYKRRGRPKTDSDGDL